MGKIELKKIEEFIAEAFKYIKDVPLFFTDGNQYFTKIKNENIVTNVYRLIIYIIVSFLIQISLLSAKSSVTYNPFEIAGMLLFQIPLVSLGYLIALTFSNTKNKIKICLNYVVFQNMITMLFPFVFLASFMNSEVYLFYYLYVILLIICFVFILLKFALLFFNKGLKQVLSGVTVIVIIILLGLSIGNLGISTTKLIRPFEDPIASEFFELDCANEIANLHTEVDVLEINGLLLKIGEKFKSGIRVRDVTYIIESGEVSRLSYNWNLSKQKKYRIANENIDRLTKKLNRAEFRLTRNLIYRAIEINKKQINLLNEYDMTVTALTNIDYNNLYKVDDNIKSLSDRENITEKDVEQYINKIKEFRVTNSNLEKINQAATSGVVLGKQAESIEQEKKNLLEDANSYMQLIIKNRKYIPFY